MFIYWIEKNSSCFRTLKKGLQGQALQPAPGVIQERRIVCIMRARRRISAQRGLHTRSDNTRAQEMDRGSTHLRSFNGGETPTMDFEHMPDVLTISDLQKVLRIGRNTAYRLINTKEIRSIRIGRSIRIPREYVEEFVNPQNISIDDKKTAAGAAQDLFHLEDRKT